MKNATAKQTKKQPNTAATNLPRHCEHVMTNGAFCRSMALRGGKFCHFHLIHLGRRIRAERRYEIAIKHDIDSRYIRMDLPLLEDANAVQLALSHVVDAVMNHAVDEKRAGLVLYALQTAVLNLRNGVNFQPGADVEVAASYDNLEEDFDLHDAAPELKLQPANAANPVAQPVAPVVTPQAPVATVVSATAPLQAAEQPSAQPSAAPAGPARVAAVSPQPAPAESSELAKPPQYDSATVARLMQALPRLFKEGKLVWRDARLEARSAA